MMSMLEKCKKAGNAFKESTEKVMSLHTSVQVNKIATLKTLYNELVETKRLGHVFFHSFRRLASSKEKISVRNKK